MTTDLSWLRRQPGTPPFVVAHRGASAQAPENTLAAARLALNMGAPAVECDVHLTADGVPIVIHDATVDRTTNGKGEVAGMTLAQLQALDAGSWHDPAYAAEPLPTLDALLAVCASKTRVFVEIKQGGGAPLVDAALEAIRRSSADVAIISFGGQEVELVARQRPDLPLGFLVSRNYVAQHGAQHFISEAGRLGATFVSPQHTAADDALVQAAHDAGLPISVWTVDEPERMQALAAIGVDAITTNKPDVALTTLGIRAALDGR